MSASVAKATRPLPELASSIRAEVEAADRDWQSALRHAIRAGELLIEAKAGCAHGGWLPWLQANFEFSIQTANGYMRAARNREQIEGSPSISTLEGALKLLAKPREDPHGPIDPFDFGKAFTRDGIVAGPDFGLPEGVVFRPTGLELPDDLPREEYDRIGSLLGVVARIWPRGPEETGSCR
jgi:hypothetical protein